MIGSVVRRDQTSLTQWHTAAAGVRGFHIASAYVVVHLMNVKKLVKEAYEGTHMCLGLKRREEVQY